MKTNDSPEVPAFFGWFNHFVASIKSAAFRTGLELAVWGKIAEGHCTAEAIAAREGWDVHGVRRLLNMLVSIGLLTTEADQYLLVSESAWYLVPGKPTYMGNFLLYLMDWEGHRQLAAAIRTGQRPIVKDIMQADLDALFGEFFAYHRAVPEQNLKGAESMWQALGITVRDGLRVLDFACGSAMPTLALCRLHPGVRATLQDRPRVLEIALEIATSLGVASQIEQLPGDMRSVDFGVNRFDIARVRNALYYMGPSEIGEVLNRVKRSMKPGGIFVTEDTVADDKVTQDAYAPIDALLLYAITEKGDTYTYAQWQSFLVYAGFINVTRVGSMIRAEVP